MLQATAHGIIVIFGALLRPPTIEAPVAWERGPPSLWDNGGLCRDGAKSSDLDHRGPRGKGSGASFALRSSRPPPHGHGGLFCRKTNQGPTAFARGPLALWCQ